SAAIEKKRDFAKEEEVPGGIFYEVHSFPFPNPDGTVTSAIEVIKDITARKKMEGELEESRMQLLESQKMATVGHLSLGIAHHINNPLSGINMSAEILSRRVEEVKDGPIFEEIKNHVARIIENSRRCEAVMKDLRHISNMPRPKRMPMDLNEALGHVLGLTAPQLKPRNIQFVKELSTTIPRVLGSPSQLETVFVNLISNAIDEMPNGGTLTVKAEHLATEGKIEVTISDTGPGISEKDLPYLFDPYFILKVRPAGRSNGLELALAQLTVQSYGGTIEADSGEGKGITFKVRLPVYQETGTVERKALKTGLVA
ncbi:MAG: sensor histidine kinase, partial [Candidatus Brocadiales bacterium]